MMRSLGDGGAAPVSVSCSRRYFDLALLHQRWATTAPRRHHDEPLAQIPTRPNLWLICGGHPDYLNFVMIGDPLLSVVRRSNTL